MTKRWHRRWWLLGLLPVLVIGGGVVAWQVAQSSLRHIVEARASAALGRKVNIDRLHFSPGRIATLTADDVVIANPEGWPAGDPPLADIKHLVIRLDLWTYLRHRQIDIPEIDVQQPHVFAAEKPDHAANYHLAMASSGGSETRIGTLRIEGGEVHAVLAPLRADFTVAVRTEQAPDRPAALLADARGTYAGQPIQASMAGGAILGLRDATHPWPINLRIANGRTEARLEGSVAQPLALAGAQLRLQFAGPSLSTLRPLTGIALPETPPFQLSGTLDFADHRVRFHDIAGRVGSSDLGGTITVEPGEPRPVVQAELASRAVDLADLGGFVGAPPGHEAAKPRARHGLLPDTKLSLPQFHYADVHLRYKATAIKGRSMPLDDLSAALDIVNGEVALHPVSFGVGVGRIRSSVRLTPANGLIRAAAEVDFQQIDVAKLMAATRAFQGAGALSGSARIGGTGDSIAAIAADGNGEIVLGMAGGDLSALLVDLSGLEFGNALLSALGMPKRTQVECLVADFVLERGVLRSRALILDTTEAVVRGTGTISLRDEAINLTIRTASKHFTIGSLPGPIFISGTMLHPRVVPGAEVAARAGAAGALAALLPPLAVLPTIQFGTKDQHRCQALLVQAHAQAPGTKPPLPQGRGVTRLSPRASAAPGPR
ncbi:MAG TPA: AsmA family protein [Acetobacteraceae bacterium]|nr:AsmA family protein [Acetobacteraceae bacterium]